MHIDFLSCAYSMKFSIKIDGKDRDILASKWFVKLSDGSWKTYLVTFYNASNKGTISKTFSKKNSIANIDTTYIQINNSNAVEQLQKQANPLKVSIPYEETKTNDIPDPFRVTSEDHFINAKGFVSTEKNLFLNNGWMKYKDKYPDYPQIQQYLKHHIAKKLKIDFENPSEKKEEEARENNKSSTTDSEALEATSPKINKKTLIPSTRCNLIILASIIFSVATIIITKLSEEPPPDVNTGWF